MFSGEVEEGEGPSCGDDAEALEEDDEEAEQVEKGWLTCTKRAVEGTEVTDDEEAGAVEEVDEGEEELNFLLM